MGDSPLSSAPGTPGPDPTPIVPSHSVNPSLTTQVVRGAAWNVVGAVAQKGLVLGATIIVARLLSPSDYAVAGLATAVMGIFVTLSAQGFTQALVQRQDLTELTCHSVFWLMAVAGLGVGGLTLASAPWLARFYNQPALAPVMWVLAAGLVSSMIGAVPNALLQRAMRFREINVIGMAGGVLSALLGIGFAWLGYGYWALIMPVVGTALFIAVCAFWLSGYRPAWAFRWSELGKVSTFGASLLGSNLVQYFADTGDSLIMGRFWSPADFGRYRFAYERSRQPFDLVLAQIHNVTFPAFSRIQDDLERLRQAFLQGTYSMCLVIFPLHVLIIGLADPLVPWIFGEQWHPAVPALQVFAAYAFVRGVASLVSAGLLAINRVQANLAFNVFRVVATLPTLLYLGFSGAGILTTSIVLVIIWGVQAPFLIGYLYKQIHLSWAESWRSLRSLVGTTAVMGLVLVASRLVAEAAAWPTWIMIVVSTILPSIVFVLLARRPLSETVQQVRTALGKA